MTHSFNQMQSSLPSGFYCENRNGYLVIYYPSGMHPMMALEIMRNAGAQGFNQSLSGPAMGFPNHAV